MHTRGTVLLLPAALLWAQVRPAVAGDVAVLLSADVRAYQEAIEGCEEALGYELDHTYDMQGEPDRGRDHLRHILSDLKPDLIIAVGVWALQAVARERGDLPVVYTMVLNPPSVVEPGVPNITGASMNVSLEQTFGVFQDLGLKRIGTVYTRAATGYLVEQARARARAGGLELVAREIRNESEAIRSLGALKTEGIDGLWIVPDKSILSDKVIREMILFSFRQRIALVGLSRRHAKMGALVSLSFASSREIGRQAGMLASRVLEGHRPADLPFTMARAELIVNLRTARKLGIQVPGKILGEAHEVLE